MKKLKVILLLIATLALVILCACLPKLTAVYIDGEAENVAVYRDMQPVELEVKEGTTAFSMLEKLSLYANGQSVDIKSANATKEEAEIKTCVETFLDKCQATGIYEGIDPSSATISTKLVYDVADPAKSLVVWRYYATKLESAKDSQTQQTEIRGLDVIVDDETGKILSVSFEHYGAGYSQDGIWDRNRKRVNLLADLYFAQLELSEKADIAEASMGKLYEYVETDAGMTQVHYTILDPACGGIKITFEVGGVDNFRATVAGE